MKRNFTLPRGMRDIGVEEMAQRQWINKKILEIYEKYNFQTVDPSPIEHLETLEAKSGEAIKNEIFWFEDKSGRKLALRFDLTVGLARMVSTRPDLPLPAKIAAISNMWRYDEPQHGRYRCFTQWDAEIFGSPEPEADGEIVSLSIDILKNLGLEKFEVRISNRKLIEGYLQSLGLVDLNKIEATLRVIDKYRKLTKEEITIEFENIGLNQTQIDHILQFVVIQTKLESFQDIEPKITVKNQKFLKGIEELTKLKDNLDALKKIDRCLLDLSIVRGIGYYDGIVFEIYDKIGEDTGAIVAGGRYNELCQVFGRDLPATGAAGGIERIILSLEKASLLPSLKRVGGVFVAAANISARRKVLELAGLIRSWGIPAEFDLMSRTLARQLEYADRLGTNFTLIVGERELKVGMVRLRNMVKREEIDVELIRLKEILTQRCLEGKPV